MKYFACNACQHQVFFANSYCAHCQSPVGYIAAHKSMGSFVIEDSLCWRLIEHDTAPRYYKPCFNYQNHQVCNWMLDAESDEIYCESCQLTQIIPDLSVAEHVLYWQKLEEAKRRFLYLMQQLNIMPRTKRSDDDHLGLRFNFLMPMNGQPVMTGHGNGVITLNASEADEVYRETTRVEMGENYRTLLGHFRHESGHYYFDLLAHYYPEVIDEFRQFFGDERQDYQAALSEHYENGPPADWQNCFISSYASTHPWEDWAETWAHYLHMMDTLETAYYAGLRVHSNQDDLADMALLENPIGAQDFEKVLRDWMTLTFNLNALNRSMGLADAYPFQLTNQVLDKLRFIHKHVLNISFSGRHLKR